MTAADPQPVDTAARLRMLAAPSRDGDWVRVRAGELRAVADELDRLCATVARVERLAFVWRNGAKGNEALTPPEERMLGWCGRQLDKALRAAPAETTVLGVPIDKARELLSDVLLHRAMRDESAMDDALDQLEELLLPEHARERRAATPAETDQPEEPGQ